MIIVLDSNVLDSGLLRPHSKPATILRLVATALPLNLLLPDPDDLPFLEVAVAARADGLVSENTRHYPARARHGVTILDLAKFVDRWARRTQH